MPSQMGAVMITRVFRVALFLGSVSLMTACGSTNQNTTKPSTAYFTAGGNCYGTNGQLAPYAQCANSNGTYVVNGSCYRSGTNQMIGPASMCASSGAYGAQSSYGTMQACYGLYRTQQGQVGQCYGMNCRGYSLINVQTNQLTRCN